MEGGGKSADKSVAGSGFEVVVDLTIVRVFEIEFLAKCE